MSKFKLFIFFLILFASVILSSCESLLPHKTAFMKEIDRLNENIYNEYDVKLLDSVIRCEDEIANDGYISSKPIYSHMPIPGHKFNPIYTHNDNQKYIWGTSTPELMLFELMPFKNYKDVRVTNLSLGKGASFYGYKIGDWNELGDDVLELYNNHLKDRYMIVTSPTYDGLIIFEYYNIKISVTHINYKIIYIEFSIGSVENTIKGVNIRYDQMNTEALREKCFDTVDKNDILVAIIPTYVEDDEIITENYIYPLFLQKNTKAKDIIEGFDNVIWFSDSTEIKFHHNIYELYLNKELTVKYEYNQPFSEDTILYGKYDKK